MLAAAAIGVLIGVVLGGLGGGGGVLTVPALVYLLDQPAQAATTSSVVIVGISAAAGVLARVRSGCIDWRTALVLGSPVRRRPWSEPGSTRASNQSWAPLAQGVCPIADTDAGR